MNHTIPTDPSAPSQRDPSADSARRCVRCGFCTATCPTYVVLGDELDSPRGRIALMKNMLNNQETPTAEVVKHIDRCLSCLSCMTTCPSDVNYMRLIDHARAYVERRYRRPWPERLLRSVLCAVLPYQHRFRTALALGRALAPLRRWLPNRGIGGSLRAMLELSGTPRFESGRSAEPPARPQAPSGRIALLRGCAEPVIQPQIRRAAARLLRRMGYEIVDVQGEVCCGALVHHLGRDLDSLAFARTNVDAWSRLMDSGALDSVAVTTSGCGTTLKSYGALLEGDPVFAERARRVSERVLDITELLQRSPPGAPRTPRNLVVAYHAACSLQHGQRVSKPPVQLLRDAGYEVRSVPDGHLCCGSAGTYNLLQPQIAGTLGERKAAAIGTTGAQVIAAGNVGCMTQIARYSTIPVVHTVELLDWAHGGPCPPRLEESILNN